MAGYRHIGVILHSTLPEARSLAAGFASRYSRDRIWWTAIHETMEEPHRDFPGTDLIVTIGGDGTILRGVHVAAPLGIPVLGVNMGRVGFMSEIDADDALAGLGWYLEGNARTESRAMLRAQVDGDGPPLDALNDVMLVRGEPLRVIEVETRIDNVLLSVYRGDGIVIATATGSTGYSLALGGPVIDPAVSDLLLKPIAAHMSQFGGVVVKASSSFHLTLRSQDPAVLSADGFQNTRLTDGQSVVVAQCPFRAMFLRRQPPEYYWKSLTRKLGMRQGAMARRSRRDDDSEGAESS